MFLHIFFSVGNFYFITFLGEVLASFILTMEALEDKKKVVEMNKSIGNMIIQEAIQVNKFGDGYLEMIGKSEETQRRMINARQKQKMVGTRIALEMYQLQRSV